MRLSLKKQYCHLFRKLWTPGWSIEGKFLVLWLVTTKIRMQKQTSNHKLITVAAPFFSFLAPGWLFSCNTVTLTIISGIHGFQSFTGTYSFILPSINLYQTIWLRLLCNCKKCCITKTSHVLPIFFLKEELTRMGEIENSLTIFVMATYGEGDPTDNAQEFYEWLQNDRDDLDCLNYTVSIYLYV